MPNIGPMEIGIVLIIALVVFGPKRLPDLGHSLGKGIREFKGSINGEDEAPAPAPKVVETAAAPKVVVETETAKTGV
jgi:sec-independent protein translocase protein TatA